MTYVWRSRYLFPAIVIAALISGCQSTTTVAQEYPQIPSYKIEQTEPTVLGKALQADIAANPGKSGLRLLETGSASYKMRLALIQAAEKTLDLQYYSMHDDTTANLLLEAIVRAAQRGVRIRMLLDSLAASEVNYTLSVLNEFKNVETRVFNPFATRDHGLMQRFMKATVNLDEFNRRMHNKALIADNQLAIIGGRNLGDEYFEENTDVTFRDIDVLTAGPVTNRISQSFDIYWNDKNSVPIAQVIKPTDNVEEVRNMRAALAAHWEEVHQTEKGLQLLDSKLSERLKDADVAMIWAPTEFVGDDPKKINKEETSVADSKPILRLDSLLENAQYEFLAVSPYFVPRPEGVTWLADMVKRGIAVKVVTNSLASTDVVAVHTGYRDYRKDVVRSGVELYEMKAVEGKRPKQRLLGASAPAHASLHAKVYVIDGKEVMIGSFNLDPRSVELNTELSIVVHSPEIAAQVKKMFNEVAAPTESYRVTLDKEDNLVWTGVDKGKPVTFHSEPHPGLWRTLQVNVMDLLPIEDNL